MGKYVIISTIMALGLLGGCSNPVNQAMAVTDSVSTAGEGLVEELNQIVITEKELQGVFEQTVEEDEELESLLDRSSPVFANVDERREALERIETYREQLEGDYNGLSEQDFSELPEEEIVAMEESLDQVTELLAEYTTHYADALTEQEQFFETLADEEATYETMTDGIDRIASTDEVTNELLLQLDEQLIQLESHYGALDSVLQEEADAS